MSAREEKLDLAGKRTTAEATVHARAWCWGCLWRRQGGTGKVRGVRQDARAHHRETGHMVGVRVERQTILPAR